MDLKIIFFTLCFICIISHLQATEPKAQSEERINNNDGGNLADFDARISLILADENEGQKSYRWGITRNSPLKVVQGWYTFDEVWIREHGGGGRGVAEAKPMQLSLLISKEDGYLVLNRSYGFSGNFADQRANIANRTQWPYRAELKTFYLSEPAGLTGKIQPLWKGEFIQNGKVVKSIIYAVKVVGENAPDQLFDINDTSELLRISSKWGPTPDPAKLIFEGRTIGGWIAQWDTRKYDEVAKATEMLIKIGRPAVPFMVDIIKQGGNHAGYAGKVLGNMGPDAEEALDWLIDTAMDKNLSNSQSNIRRIAVSCLINMTWASERLLPVFTKIAEDTNEEISLRSSALIGLSNTGGQAMDVIKKIADSDSREIRDAARGLMSQFAVKEGRMTRAEYYTRLVEENPYDPSVPRYLSSTKGMVNSGEPHPLTEKVRALQRERLKENPDPELAWILAQIIQNELQNTALEWAAPTDSSRGRSSREVPAESFTTMAEVLELGLEHAQADSQLWHNLGIALAKLRLLQGDWNRMNLALKKLGQKAIPAELRSWLAAPPVDWDVGVASHWQMCDGSMRSGDCSLEFKIEKDDRGLKGVHVLVKRAPEPTNVFHSGIAADTLFLAPYPVGDDRFSFGYRGGDREQTRYAISDNSGVVRFEKLPAIPIKIEVLVPTSNFPEAGTNWDLWMEVGPGQFKIARPFGGPDAVSTLEPPAVVTLKHGQTVHYPKLVVRPAFTFNVRDWECVAKDDFVLSWQGLDPKLQEKTAHYELEMSLSAPSETPRLDDSAHSVVRSAKQILTDTKWPVGSKGIDGLCLEPGNIYIFEVRAVDDSGTVIACWPKTRIWIPWGYRRSNPPMSGINTNLEDNSPIFNEVWFRGTFRYGDGREETLPQRVERFLRERPDAFEREYVQMGKAWLDWHAGKTEEARMQLEQLVQELPKGNLARGTAARLLQQMDNNEAPPKRLTFVPDTK
jgi:HEAT repeat protein